MSQSITRGAVRIESTAEGKVRLVGPEFTTDLPGIHLVTYVGRGGRRNPTLTIHPVPGLETEAVESARIIADAFPTRMVLRAELTISEEDDPWPMT